MATIDWLVLIICLSGIIYCAVTMPKPMILTREQWLQLPEEQLRKPDKD